MKDSEMTRITMLQLLIIVLTIINIPTFGSTVYMNWSTPVMVNGHPLHNCHMEEQPGKIIWTCGP